MTSYFLLSQGRRPAEAQCTRSLGLGYKICALIPVADRRTHGTTFRALKVTSQVGGNSGGGRSLRSMTCVVVQMHYAGSPFIVSVGGQPSGRVRETATTLVQQPELIVPGQKAHIMLKIPGLCEPSSSR